MVRVLRPHGAPAEWRQSGCGWRGEGIHGRGEHVLEGGLGGVRVLPDERDHLAIAVGSLTVVATGLRDHAEASVAVVHVGERHQEIAGSLLGLVELAGTDEFGGGVGRDGQFVLVSVLGAGEPRRNGGSHLTKVQAMRDGAFDAPRFGLGPLLARDRLLLGQATLLILVAAAAGAGVLAAGRGPCGQRPRAEERGHVARWRRWGRDRFPTPSFWQLARARFMPPVDQNRLRAALIERFTGDDADRLVALLRLIAPITGGNRNAG